MTILKVKSLNGEPAELGYRIGAGEPTKGGGILSIRSNGSGIVEIWVSATDKKAIRGLLV